MSQVNIITIPTMNYITWLRQSYYVFNAQLKFTVRIHKIRENRYNAVKLSLHMFIA